MNMATQAAAPTDDERIEHEIQRKGKTAPRLTPAHIEDVIADEHYFTAGEGMAAASGAFPNHGHPGQPLALLTFCVLVLRNGFTVTGESACVSPENFDAEIGRKVARQNAVAKIWPLEGYLLKQRLHEAA
ncbi:Gp49 family protein [Burkholderia contaminans]|uniref:Gp49 family protein n=1 Tax=Burkholderia contaminans TaxID=488447 RepID=UPI00214F65BF|nr:Gp49 family protein [Burkholderia contaminans]UUX38869.1 Gp49 family protein [Burkholderia contaminans]